MDKEKLISAVKTFIKNDDIPKAIKALEELCQGSAYGNELIQYSDQYTDYQLKDSTNILGFNETLIIKNRIVGSLLKLMNKLEKGNTPQSPLNSIPNSSQ